MPAARGRRCADCYYEALANKRAKIDCTAFSTPAFAAHFAAFGKWLTHTRGARKASLTIQGYLPFFFEIEREWGGGPRLRPPARAFRGKAVAPVAPSGLLDDGDRLDRPGSGIQGSRQRPSAHQGNTPKISTWFDRAQGAGRLPPQLD